MAKRGLKAGLPASGKKEVVAEDIIQQMKVQSTPLKVSAFGASIVDRKPNERKFEIINIDGVDVKRYI